MKPSRILTCALGAAIGWTSLDAGLAATMRLPEVRDALTAQATESTSTTPQEFLRIAQNELDKYCKVVKSMGLKVE